MRSRPFKTIERIQWTIHVHVAHRPAPCLVQPGEASASVVFSSFPHSITKWIGKTLDEDIPLPQVEPIKEMVKPRFRTPAS